MKLKLTFILFLLPSYLCFAQDYKTYDTWLKFYNEGYDLYSKQNYTDAVEKLKKAAEYINQINFNTNDKTQYYPIYNYDYLGLSYQSLGDFENAAESFTKAMELLSSVENMNVDYGKQILNSLISCYEKYDLNKALEFRQQYLNGIAKESGKISIPYAEQLFAISLINKNLQETNAFIENLEEAYSIHKELESTDHIHYPYIVFNLAYTYYHRQDYANALIYFKKMETNLEPYQKDPYINIGKLNYDYALSLYKQGFFAESESKFKDLLNDPWLKSIENAEFYLYTTNYIGLSAYYQNKIEDAELAYETSFPHLENTLGATSPLFALQKTNYIRLLIDTANYDPALKLSEEVYKTLQENGHTDSKAYLNVVNNLGMLYMQKSDFEKAETFIKTSIDLAELSFHYNALDKSHLKSNLAYIYQKLSKYDEAKSLHEEVLKTKTELLNPNSQDYAIALMNFGTYLFETGEHIKAEDYFLKSEAIFKNNNDTGSIAYTSLLLNLAQLYDTKRNLKQSLDNYEKAIDIYSKSGLEKSENMALALHGKASALLAIGDINEATKSEKQSFEIVENNFDHTSLQYGNAAFNYGSFYYYLEDYTNAQNYFTEAYKVFEKHLDYGSPEFIKIAEYYIKDLVANKDYETALQLIEKIEENVISNYGFESFYYAKVLYDKAKISTLMGNYEYASRLYQSVSTVFQKTVDKNSDTYTNMLFNYGRTLDQLGETDQAIEKYKEQAEGIKNQLKDLFTYRNEEDKKKFMQQLSIYNDWLNASIFKDDENYSNLISIGLNNQLMLKSLLLNTSKEIISNLSKSNDPEIKSKIDDYSNLKYQLSDPKILSNAEKTANLRSRINALETELVKLYNTSENRKGTENFDKDWLSIKKNLTPNAIAIEFVEFEMREGNYLSGKRACGAYLMHSTWDKPKVVQLVTLEDLKKALKKQDPNSLYQTRGSKAKNTTNTKGLYELLWAPLEPYLENIETIYYSPSGLLNQIPFAALDTEGKPILASQFNLVQLTNSFNITSLKKSINDENTLFIGGIDYDGMPAKTSDKSDIAYKLSSLKSVSGTRSLGSSWNYLPGTLNEVNSLQKLFSKNGKSISVLTDKEATESAFKSLNANSPNIIHIATHGFFFENKNHNDNDMFNSPETIVYKKADDPLLRSGLLFAGANVTWQNSENANSENDGVLTALEISNLDLSNTDMVVLSACETGLGDIDGSEGVYGLQRAFKMAGVDIIVMSLWEVPDVETAEFMNIFYTNWLNGEPIREAFRNTQLEMSNTYKDNPEKWAAFVLIE
ncbi:CHAT domain-containing protein [uncultured Winogradskyella sp.]|uniref:CHAT domain-containing protein n=1 Tax=uncultured Winogradskyella sp. TaxID=395353 RepID=UPI0035184B23